MSLSETEKLYRFSRYVDFVLVIFCAAIFLATGYFIREAIIKNRNIQRGSIATAVITNPKTGLTRKYEIYRFMVTENNRCVFETIDGRTVEVRGTEVTEHD